MLEDAVSKKTSKERNGKEKVGKDVKTELGCDVAGSHVESFNYVIDEGLEQAVANIAPVRFHIQGEPIEIRLHGVRLEYPILSDKVGVRALTSGSRLMPKECRQRALTYKAPMFLSVSACIGNQFVEPMEVLAGHVPIMLRSKRCHLHGLGERELVAAGEEALEMGGYFIVNGTEKVVRFLIMMRRNYPVGLRRARFRERGKLFSEFAVTMRCVRGSHTAAANTIHYLETGTMTINFRFQRELFQVPLMYILKGLVGVSDREIFEAMIRGRESDDFWRGCVLNMLHLSHDGGATGHQETLKLLGSRFRIKVGLLAAPWDSDEAVGRILLRNCIAIHLDEGRDKFNLLVLMAQKLVAMVRGHCAVDSPDNPQFQETAMSGHIMLMLIKDRLEASLRKVKVVLDKTAQRKKSEYVLSPKEMHRVLNGMDRLAFSKAMERFLATGTLPEQADLSMQQQTGYAVIAERINQLRFISHFRAIHRGSAFQEMRTTDVRKLRPEAWGFICPVHTPDGAPCGLLNHLTASCRLVTHSCKTQSLIQILGEEGLRPLSSSVRLDSASEYPVLLDGKLVGHLAEDCVARTLNRVRHLKVSNKDARFIEVVLVPFPSENLCTQFAGLFLFSEPSRMMRPVWNLAEDAVEYVGTFEQVYLSICLDKSEMEPGVTRHQEISPRSLFSFAANLIPLPDHNQSPRNVYQCQMGKQTMGIPIHSWRNRADHKMYQLQTPQSPLVKPEAYDAYRMDDYPLGTNAIVAVISYTGYDMEDAMVINRSSFQRGFAHGSIHKTEHMDLRERARRTGICEVFSRDPSKPRLAEFLGEDGLPISGRVYHLDDPYLCTVNPDHREHYCVHKFKNPESGFLKDVRVLASDAGDEKLNNVALMWRIARNPIIGDKFASRHGQKGINSFLWPQENMPFTESGMVPDIIFNPHGFPSRMTIGMMIEMMAGKAAAMHGWEQDATPFVFNEKHTAVDHYGDLLAKAGFNHYGTEIMYSGVDGREMEADIFFGVVYYQRLRHMIADKYQVRATGTVDAITRQPVQGRKRAGGVRFGEMERDALISHGASAVLQDRLFNCSDRDVAEVCADCGTLLSVQLMCPESSDASTRDTTFASRCRICGDWRSVRVVPIPSVFLYLVSELLSMNIKTKLEIKGTQ